MKKNTSILNKEGVTSRPWQSWVVVFVAASFFFLIFVHINILNTISPLLIKDLNFGTSQIGLLASAYFFGNMIFVIPAGVILDRFSVKKNLLFALAVAAFCAYIFSRSSSLEVMLVCRFAIGIVGSYCFLGSVKLATRWFPPHKMALIVGLLTTVGMFGGMIAQAPMSMIANTFGWRNSMLFIASLGAMFFILVAFFVKDYPPGYKKSASSQGSIADFWRSLALTLTNRQNWLAATYISMINLPVFMLGATWGGMYLSQAAHLSAAQGSLVTTMLFVGMIVGSPLMGWLSDRLGERKRPKIVGAILSLMTILAIVYLPGLSFVSFMVLFFILGVVVSSQVIGFPLIAESNPKALSATASSIGSFMLVTAGTLTPVFGWLMGINWDRTVVDNIPIYSVADYRLAMMSIVISFILGLLASLFLKETYCQPLQEE